MDANALLRLKRFAGKQTLILTPHDAASQVCATRTEDRDAIVPAHPDE
jgi:hypothetical protein